MNWLNSKKDAEGKKIRGPEGWPLGVWIMFGLIAAGALYVWLST